MYFMKSLQLLLSFVNKSCQRQTFIPHWAKGSGRGMINDRVLLIEPLIQALDIVDGSNSSRNNVSLLIVERSGKEIRKGLSLAPWIDVFPLVSRFVAMNKSRGVSRCSKPISLRVKSKRKREESGYIIHSRARDFQADDKKVRFRAGGWGTSKKFPFSSHQVDAEAYTYAWTVSRCWIYRFTAAFCIPMNINRMQLLNANWNSNNCRFSVPSLPSS